MNISTEDVRNLLRESIELIQQDNLHECCKILLNDERFFKFPGAAKKHQAHDGGLALHTSQIIDIARNIAQSHTLKEKINRDILIAGALWHDYGKIWDYQRNFRAEGLLGEARFDEKGQEEPDWIYTRHRWSIRHLSRSFAEFMKAAEKTKVPEELCEEVGHCILAHHGPNSDSPVPPLTIEAYIIHTSDVLSAIYLENPHIFREPQKDWKTLPVRTVI